MASLKDLKVRIGSVKNTQKITKAMKMVAAAKLRRATEHAEAARPYAEHMEHVVRAMATQVKDSAGAPVLLAGTGKEEVHLLVVMTSDRGLCGGFNSSLVRAVKERVTSLQAGGKTVKLLIVGRKGFDQLQMTHHHLLVDSLKDITRKKLEFTDASLVAETMLRIYEEEGCDVCSIVYNKFKSAISQEVTFQQLIPLSLPDEEEQTSVSSAMVYDFEPEEHAILADLLPRNIAVQTYRALLENAASEQGARMTAMDNATRNAGEMIKKLTLLYNRTRQAAITKELIEIISGAEAV